MTKAPQQDTLLEYGTSNIRRQVFPEGVKFMLSVTARARGLYSLRGRVGAPCGCTVGPATKALRKYVMRSREQTRHTVIDCWQLRGLTSNSAYTKSQYAMQHMCTFAHT